jgi:lysine 2,3-aminomutase
MVGRSEVLRHRPDLASVWDDADALFPVRMTASVWQRVRHGDPDDPIARQLLPSAAELVEDAGDLADPVGDARCSPAPWVVHKYPDRVLLLMTKRCHVYCRYCFRRTHKPEELLDPSPEAWEAALAYVGRSGARELILSGGDPLAVSDARLFETIDRAKAMGIRRIRVHTRAPIAYPRRITPALVEGLQARAPVWVVVHCNHAAELAPDVDLALQTLVRGGVPVLNQSVLLAGVNDDADALAALCEALVDRGVKPYYLHHPDQVAGNAAFRVDARRGLELVAALRARVSGIAFPRYVVDPPEGTGKRDVVVEPDGS